MPNLQMTSNEFKTFKELVDFLIALAPPKVQGSKLDRYKIQIGILLGGMNGGTVYNQLLDNNLVYPHFSKKTFDHFCSNFNRIVSMQDDKSPSLKETKEIYKRWFDVVNRRFQNGELIIGEAKKKSLQTKENVLSSSDFLKSFEDSRWYCYECDDKSSISRKVLRFEASQRKNYLVATLSKKKMTWKGEAKISNAERLMIISLTNSNSGEDYTHFLVNVENRVNEPDVCIGHKTFKNIKDGSIVTKTVVLHRYTDPDSEPVSEQFNLNNKDIHKNILNFLTIPYINQLSTPSSTTVFDIETLGRAWLKNKPKSENFPSIIGDYTVYYRYKTTTTDFTRDKLRIFQSEDGLLSVEYIHEQSKGEKTRWVGNAYPNFETKILTIYLQPVFTSSVIEDYKEEYDNPMFLMVNIPSRDQRIIDTLTAVAVASRDGDKGAVGRLMVLTQIDIESSDETKAQLNNFFDFYWDRSWIRPPISIKVPAISKFEHLQEAIEDSKKMHPKNELQSCLQRCRELPKKE